MQLRVNSSCDHNFCNFSAKKLKNVTVQTLIFEDPYDEFEGFSKFQKCVWRSFGSPPGPLKISVFWAKICSNSQKNTKNVEKKSLWERSDFLIMFFHVLSSLVFMFSFIVFHDMSSCFMILFSHCFVFVYLKVLCSVGIQPLAAFSGSRATVL